MGKYKHGKLTTTIDFAIFRDRMEQNKFEHSKYRSFVAFLYWFGVRRNEALSTRRSDFKIDHTNNLLIANCEPKKHGTREPLEIQLDLPYVDLILNHISKFKGYQKVWQYSSVTAWRKVKKIMGEKFYPHYFRLNRATKFLQDPTTTIPEMKAWFGWKAAKSIDPYIGYSRRDIKKQSKRLARDLE